MPPAVDRECVSAQWHLRDLGHVLVATLLLEAGVGDCPRHGVVVLPGEDQERSAIGIPGVDLCFGPGVEVRRRGLENRRPGRRYREPLVQLLRLALADA